MTMLRLGGINFLSMNDTDGIAASIFFQGCKFDCRGCHNPELQSFSGGELVTAEDVITKIQEHVGWYDAVAFMGGEPLEQPKALLELIRSFKYLGLKIWLYTGYDVAAVPRQIKVLCDVIVAGVYIEGLKTGGFPPSSNQEIYKGDGI